MREGCESLITAADLLRRGEEARTALAELLSGERLDNQETMRVRLPRDLKTIWEAEKGRRGRFLKGIPTAFLIVELSKIEEWNWDNYYGCGSIGPHGIASLLKYYGIRPRNVKTKDGRVPKGYRRDDLQAPWGRYLR